MFLGCLSNLLRQVNISLLSQANSVALLPGIVGLSIELSVRDINTELSSPSASLKLRTDHNSANTGAPKTQSAASRLACEPRPHSSSPQIDQGSARSKAAQTCEANMIPGRHRAKSFQRTSSAFTDCKDTATPDVRRQTPRKSGWGKSGLRTHWPRARLPERCFGGPRWADLRDGDKPAKWNAETRGRRVYPSNDASETRPAGLT